MKRQRILILSALTAAAAAVLAVFYFLAKQGIGLGCPLYQLTGLQCPGCGNSRAALALLRLDIAGALGYNFLFPLEFGYLLWVIGAACRTYLNTGRFCYRPRWIWIDITVLVLVVSWGIVRNVL